MAVDGIFMDAVAESVRNPVGKVPERLHQFGDGCVTKMFPLGSIQGRTS